MFFTDRKKLEMVAPEAALPGRRRVTPPSGWRSPCFILRS